MTYGWQYLRESAYLDYIVLQKQNRHKYISKAMYTLNVMIFVSLYEFIIGFGKKCFTMHSKLITFLWALTW